MMPARTTTHNLGNEAARQKLTTFVSKTWRDGVTIARQIQLLMTEYFYLIHSRYSGF
jgi:hypothetical protein